MNGNSDSVFDIVHTFNLCVPLTSNSRREGKFEISFHIIYAVSRLHIVWVNVSKPTNSTSFDLFQEFALLVQDDKVFLNVTILLKYFAIKEMPHMFIWDISNSKRAIWLNTWRCDRRPAVLSQSLASATRVHQCIWPRQNTFSCHSHAE